MSAAAVVTLILVAVAVIVIAGYLTIVALALNRVSSKLKQVVSSVNEIPGKTEPVPAVIDGMNKDLDEAAGLLEDLVAKQSGRPSTTGPTSGVPDNIW